MTPMTLVLLTWLLIATAMIGASWAVSPPTGWLWVPAIFCTSVLGYCWALFLWMVA